MSHTTGLTVANERSAIEKTAINTIRTLAMDAVQAANSGHPGTPMGMAPTAYVLWQRFLRFDPDDPIWPNRDRFVLSAGHASMLLYALLHLTGVKAVNRKYETLGELSVKLDDIKKFRQLGSKCPGHPEYRWTSGVETTTGPLGQGVANSVGMAMAGRWLAAHFNRPGFELFDFDVYALCGDGDMMEGISSEAASLAGHLKLSNLCWIYDSNHITIEGNTDLAFSEDVATRFLGYGWNVTRVGDANDLEMLDRAFARLQGDARPADAHHRRQPHRLGRAEQAGHQRRPRRAARRGGSPLDQAQLRLARGRQVPGPRRRLRALPRRHRQARPAAARGLVRAASRSTGKQYPDLADQLMRMQRRELPEGWDKGLPAFPPDAKGLATRDSSGKVLNALAKNVPWLIGGAADLAPSTKTRLTFDGAGDFEADSPGGRNLHFGIREHAMGAIAQRPVADARCGLTARPS